jgi:acyl-CoA synthetase (NDP forming)
VPTIADLPFQADMLVVAVDAAQVPDLLEEIIVRRAALGLLVIPGGLGERAGTEGAQRRIQAALAAARAAGADAPVINGGNCLGIVSRPGRCDTFFLPDAKLPPNDGPVSALAVISQSGAFAASRATRLEALNPRYMISVGNQIDLTVGDWLRALETDREIDVFACYVEGFRPLDGAHFLECAARLAREGRAVILYRAGRTAAGAGAAATHTAAVAGDWAVARALAGRAGVILADTLDDFDDLVRTFTLLHRKRAAGLRLGAMSNAGFECVAMADRLGRFTLARFSEGTAESLRLILRRARLDGIVDVHDPFDTTPILGDEGFADAARAILDDPGVDAAVIGCVPMTGALETLPPGCGHAEDLGREGSVASRLARLATHPKPWVAVVDAGPLYDPMALRLERAGVPTFRSADRALRALEAFCHASAGRPAGLEASGAARRSP